MTQIRLRPAVPSDADFLFSMASDADVVQWIGDGTPWKRTYFDERFTRALSATDDQEPDVPRWFVGTNGEPRPIGLLSLIRRSDHVEVGYWVHRAHWGRGYAGEMLDQAQNLTDIVPMAAQVYRANSASRRVLERAGFTLVDDGDPLTYRRAPRT